MKCILCGNICLLFWLIIVNRNFSLYYYTSLATKLEGVGDTLYNLNSFIYLIIMLQSFQEADKGVPAPQGEGAQAGAQRCQRSTSRRQDRGVSQFYQVYISYYGISWSSK